MARNTIELMSSFLSCANISSLGAVLYLRNSSNNISNIPNVAIAISCGGYGALMRDVSSHNQHRIFSE